VGDGVKKVMQEPTADNFVKGQVDELSRQAHLILGCAAVLEFFYQSSRVGVVNTQTTIRAVLTVLDIAWARDDS